MKFQVLVAVIVLLIFLVIVYSFQSYGTLNVKIIPENSSVKLHLVQDGKTVILKNVSNENNKIFAKPGKYGTVFLHNDLVYLYNGSYSRENYKFVLPEEVEIYNNKNSFISLDLNSYRSNILSDFIIVRFNKALSQAEIKNIVDEKGFEIINFYNNEAFIKIPESKNIFEIANLFQSMNVVESTDLNTFVELTG